MDKGVKLEEEESTLTSLDRLTNVTEPDTTGSFSQEGCCARSDVGSLENDKQVDDRSAQEKVEGQESPKHPSKNVLQPLNRLEDANESVPLSTSEILFKIQLSLDAISSPSKTLTQNEQTVTNHSERTTSVPDDDNSSTPVPIASPSGDGPQMNEEQVESTSSNKRKLSNNLKQDFDERKPLTTEDILRAHGEKEKDKLKTTDHEPVQSESQMTKKHGKSYSLTAITSVWHPDLQGLPNPGTLPWPYPIQHLLLQKIQDILEICFYRFCQRWDAALCREYGLFSPKETTLVGWLEAVGKMKKSQEDAACPILRKRNLAEDDFETWYAETYDYLYSDIQLRIFHRTKMDVNECLRVIDDARKIPLFLEDPHATERLDGVMRQTEQAVQFVKDKRERLLEEASMELYRLDSEKQLVVADLLLQLEDLKADID